MKSFCGLASAQLPLFGLFFGSIAYAGSITWSNDAAFTMVNSNGGPINILTGGGSLGSVTGVGQPMLSSIGDTGEALTEFSGMEFDGGSFTYTSGPKDATTGVVLNFQAGRSFTATAGTYVLESVLQGSVQAPAAGLVTKISLSTIDFAAPAGTPSEALATFGPQKATDNSFSSIVIGTAYEYNSATDDKLFMTGEIDISPTAQGQVFTINFPVAVGSQIAPVSLPEPGTFFLVCVGIGCVTGTLALNPGPRNRGVGPGRLPKIG